MYDSEFASFRRKILRRVLWLTALLMTVTAYGTLGIYFLEDVPLFDAFYMAVITLTTVGFSEVVPLSHNGRLFAVSIIFMGLICTGISVGVLSRLVFEDTLAKVMKGKLMKKDLRKLANHFIVCGYGTTGQSIVEELLERGERVVVIDAEPQDAPVQAGVLFVQGDARLDHILEELGIHKAKGLASTLPSDADNVFVTLSAHTLNPKLKIVSRFKDEDTEKKLLAAGAETAISPYRIGGQRLALALCRSAFPKNLEAKESQNPVSVPLSQLSVPENAPILGKQLQHSHIRAQSFGALVVAVIDGEKQIFNPPPEYVFQHPCRLLVLGDEEQVKALKTYLHGGSVDVSA